MCLNLSALRTNSVDFPLNIQPTMISRDPVCFIKHKWKIFFNCLRYYIVKEENMFALYMNVYTNLKRCPGCNGPIFKFVNVSDDTFHVQCGYTSHIQGDVTINKITYKNIFTPSKKLPCGFKKDVTNDIIDNIPLMDHNEDFDDSSHQKKLHSDLILGLEDDYIQSDDDDDDDDDDAQEEGYELDDADDEENDDVDESEEEEPLDD